MVKHNNAISDVHFRKDWERHVYTWFDQAPQKKARRLKRQRKAARIFPRPVKGLLKPIVRCPSAKYNTKLREGYGFTYEELKAAGVNKREARNIGISVDPRRRNKSNSTFEPNVERLKQYMTKLVLFPRKVSKSKLRDNNKDKKAKPDAQAETPKTETPKTETPKTEIAKPKTAKPKTAKKSLPPHYQVKGYLLPIKRQKAKVEWRVIEPYERKGVGAFTTMRIARSDARRVGKKSKAEAEAAELAFKKAAAGGAS